MYDHCVHCLLWLRPTIIPVLGVASNVEARATAAAEATRLSWIMHIQMTSPTEPAQMAACITSCAHQPKQRSQPKSQPIRTPSLVEHRQTQQQPSTDLLGLHFT